MSIKIVKQPTQYPLSKNNTIILLHNKPVKGKNLRTTKG